MARALVGVEARNAAFRTRAVYDWRSTYGTAFCCLCRYRREGNHSETWTNAPQSHPWPGHTALPSRRTLYGHSRGTALGTHSLSLTSYDAPDVYTNHNAIPPPRAVSFIHKLSPRKATSGSVRCRTAMTSAAATRHVAGGSLWRLLNRNPHPLSLPSSSPCSRSGVCLGAPASTVPTPAAASAARPATSSIPRPWPTL